MEESLVITTPLNGITLDRSNGDTGRMIRSIMQFVFLHSYSWSDFDEWVIGYCEEPAKVNPEEGSMALWSVENSRVTNKVISHFSRLGMTRVKSDGRRKFLFVYNPKGPTTMQTSVPLIKP